MNETQTPLITVGIPTYNRPEGLRHTLKRITQQTYSNLEIIISDNCSVEADKVQEVIKEYTHDSRIKYIRQAENIGSIRNFLFLLTNATGKYFLWAADDDEVETNYIEELHKGFLKKPSAAISMTSYDVIDKMSEPYIYTNLSKYLEALQAPTTYERLRKYLLQADHYGKSRLVWGMFETKKMQAAFQFCLERRPRQDTTPIWSELPIEMQMLTYGDIVMSDKVLFHVSLLPTSEGKQALGHGKKLLDIAARSATAYRQVVANSSLTSEEQGTLSKIVQKNEIKNKVNITVYYTIQKYFPYVARIIKKLWYAAA